MGLGGYWGEVIDVLKEIIPVYDKVNSCISLGKDVQHRNRAIKGRISKGFFNSWKCCFFNTSPLRI